MHLLHVTTVNFTAMRWNDIHLPMLAPLCTGLFRMGGPPKLADFLARDFSGEANRAAAAKNAYVLLGQHKQELAATFFLLGRAPLVEDYKLLCYHASTIFCTVKSCGSSAQRSEWEQVSQVLVSQASQVANRICVV